GRSRTGMGPCTGIIGKEGAMLRQSASQLKVFTFAATLALLVGACVPAEPPATPKAPAAAPAAPAAPAASPAAQAAAAAPTQAPAAPAPAAAKTTKELKVGLLYPTTGNVATLGQAMVNGHILAADEINAAGGIRSLGGATIQHDI